MDIFNPPQSYIDFRCALHDVPDEEISEKMRKFYKANEGAREEIIKFSKWLYEARNSLILPIERVEIREADGRKRGNFERMMLWDIQYWLEKGQIKTRKIYMRLECYLASQNQIAGSWVKDPHRPKDDPFWHRPDCPYVVSGWDGNLKWKCCRFGHKAGGEGTKRDAKEDHNHSSV